MWKAAGWMPSLADRAPRRNVEPRTHVALTLGDAPPLRAAAGAADEGEGTSARQ